MLRIHDEIQLDRDEIECLYKYLFGGPVPDNQTIETAGLACVFYIGVEYVEETLHKCRKEIL